MVSKQRPQQKRQGPNLERWLAMKITRKKSVSKGRKPRAGSGRPAKRKFTGEPGISSESNVADAAAAPPSSSPEAQVSFFITQAQKAQLRAKGYSDDQITHMKPAEAHQILGLG
jgi:hypothetical protein